MDNLLTKIFTYIFAITMIFGGVFIFCAIVSLPFWLMWNWLIPPIFGLPVITWLQAFGLWTFLVLIRSSNFKYSDVFNTTLKTNETDGSEKSPFGDNTWNQWVEQVKKKYSA
jgi:hypothetical protein|tara:strand:+ start:18 stop:353 length:336 start_codon:yes stop_codon:yes gene_type:complete